MREIQKKMNTKMHPGHFIDEHNMPCSMYHRYLLFDDIVYRTLGRVDHTSKFKVHPGHYIYTYFLAGTTTLGDGCTIRPIAPIAAL